MSVCQGFCRAAIPWALAIRGQPLARPVYGETLSCAKSVDCFDKIEVVCCGAAAPLRHLFDNAKSRHAFFGKT